MRKPRWVTPAILAVLAAGMTVIVVTFLGQPVDAPLFAGFFLLIGLSNILFRRRTARRLFRPDGSARYPGYTDQADARLFILGVGTIMTAAGAAILLGTLR